jgi:hypothetical protein
LVGKSEGSETFGRPRWEDNTYRVYTLNVNEFTAILLIKEKAQR